MTPSGERGVIEREREKWGNERTRMSATDLAARWRIGVPADISDEGGEGWVWGRSGKP